MGSWGSREISFRFDIDFIQLGSFRTTGRPINKMSKIINFCFLNIIFTWTYFCYLTNAALRISTLQFSGANSECSIGWIAIQRHKILSFKIIQTFRDIESEEVASLNITWVATSDLYWPPKVSRLTNSGQIEFLGWFFPNSLQRVIFNRN